MRLIQYLLLIVFGLMVIVYFQHWRNRLRDRLLLLAFAAVGSLAVLFPDFSTVIASWVGVGRGADLIFYLAIAGLSFFCFLLYAHIREMDRRFTELTRAIAIKTAKESTGS